jgi:hypothetical protein
MSPSAHGDPAKVRGIKVVETLESVMSRRLKEKCPHVFKKSVLG